MAMLAGKRQIRVLVVDDSAVMRKLITSILEKDPEIVVAGAAIDGTFALSKIEQLRPDVITLDVDMPGENGLNILRQIRAGYDIPVIMVSSLTSQGAQMAIEALAAGAFEIVCKPRESSRIGDVARELIEKVKAAVCCQASPPGGSADANYLVRHSAVGADRKGQRARIIAIGASSGGPNALRRWLPLLPASFPCPIVIVQHLPESFSASFASWMNVHCQIQVQEARQGMTIRPGLALVAPGGAHLRIRRQGEQAIVEVDHQGFVNGHRPSVEVLFDSVATEFGAEAIAIIMTGMGDDGADAIGRIRQKGGLTIAQDAASCMIYGMPRVAVERGNIDEIVPLSDIARYLLDVLGSRVAERASG